MFCLQLTLNLFYLCEQICGSRTVLRNHKKVYGDYVDEKYNLIPLLHMLYRLLSNN